MVVTSCVVPEFGYNRVSSVSVVGETSRFMGVFMITWLDVM